VTIDEETVRSKVNPTLVPASRRAARGHASSAAS